MIESLREKRKFIVGLNDPELTTLVSAGIQEHIQNAQIVYADDGLSLLQKVENDPPHVIVLRDDLPKMRGYEVIDSLFHKGPKDFAVIFINELPESLQLADQVATGQLQFISPAQVTSKFAAGLARALNWISRGDNVEFKLKFLASGDVLMRQGEVAESVYILKRGHMKAYLKSPDTGDQVVTHGVLLGEIEPKEFVGEMAYINGDVRSADVIADTDCELIEIPIPHLDRLLFQKPAWAMALMRTLSKRMKTVNQQLAEE